MLTSIDYHDRYNSLASVDAASKMLTSRDGYMTRLRQLGSLIASAKLEQFLTIRLLHGHHTLSEGEAMVQRLESFDGKPCLATVKSAQAGVAERCAPSVWRCFEDGQIEPYEFGHATLYAIPDDFFSKHRSFFARFAEMVEDFDLSGVLGLGLRSHALDFDPASEMLAEVTRVDRDILIKYKVKDRIGLPEGIDTAWCGGESLIWPFNACHSCDPSSDDPQTGLPRHSKSTSSHERRKDDKPKDEKDNDTKRPKN